MKKLFILLLMFALLMGVDPVLAAGPMVKFSPSTGTYKNGEPFNVNIGVDSGTEKVQAIDIRVTFDANLVQVDSIDPLNNITFPGLTIDSKEISNDTGLFKFSLYNDASTFEGGAVTGDLVKVTFKPKAKGTIKVNFACVEGSTIDTNIFNILTNEVINCASNINGVYTITDGGTANPDPTAVPTIPPSNDNPDPTAAPTQSNELPQTGTVETTIGLIIFGIVSVLSSLALKFL